MQRTGNRRSRTSEYRPGESYRDVLDDYATHPEPKSVDAMGEEGRCACGLLARRAVTATSVKYVGKEFNEVEEVGAGLIHDLDDVQLLIEPPNGGLSLCARMQHAPVAMLARRARLSERQVIRIRTGESVLSPATRAWIEYALDAIASRASTKERSKRL